MAPPGPQRCLGYDRRQAYQWMNPLPKGQRHLFLCVCSTLPYSFAAMKEGGRELSGGKGQLGAETSAWRVWPLT